MHVIVTAGHVGHGKTTLIGALTGTPPERLPEERERALTIDLGFASTSLRPDSEVTFIDVPGDASALKNLLAGVDAVNACLLVVSAVDGWQAQTEEHLRVLDLLGIGQGLVVITKVAQRDQAEVRTLHQRLLERLSNTFLADAEVVAVDVVEGIGEKILRDAMARLLARTPKAIDRDRPRLWIDHAFTTAAGTVVTGTLGGGSLHIGDTLSVLPSDRPVVVRGLHTHKDAQDSVPPGYRVAVNLSGVEASSLAAGAALVNKEHWVHTSEFDAAVTVLPSLDRPLTKHGSYVAYIGSGEFPVTLRLLGRAALAPGAVGPVRVTLQSGLPLLPSDRFVLRDAARHITVAGGRVLETSPQLESDHQLIDAGELIERRGLIDVDELARLTGVRRAPTFGRWVADPEYLTDLTYRLQSLILTSGLAGIELTSLSDAEQALLSTLDGVEINGSVARTTANAESLRASLSNSTLMQALDNEPLRPQRVFDHDVPNVEFKELTRRNMIVEHKGQVFSRRGIEQATNQLADLFDKQPRGFTDEQLAEQLAKPPSKQLAKQPSEQLAEPLAKQLAETRAEQPSTQPSSRRYQQLKPMLQLLEDTGITQKDETLNIAGPELPKQEIDLRVKEQRRSRDQLQL